MFQQLGVPVLGVENWSNGWLPALYQGTVIRPREPRILNLDPPENLRGEAQEKYLGFLRELNADHLKARPGELDLDARIAKLGAAHDAVFSFEASRVDTDKISLATSGIAGPGGATPSKPVGTVWIAVSGPEGTVSRLLQLGKGRERIIQETALYAMNLLRKMILSVS